jgi:hypothetical protein
MNFDSVAVFYGAENLVCDEGGDAGVGRAKALFERRREAGGVQADPKVAAETVGPDFADPHERKVIIGKISVHKASFCSDDSVEGLKNGSAVDHAGGRVFS